MAADRHKWQPAEAMNKNRKPMRSPNASQTLITAALFALAVSVSSVTAAQNSGPRGTQTQEGLANPSTRPSALAEERPTAWRKPSFWNLLSADDQATWMRLAPKTWAQMSEGERRDWKRILTPRPGEAIRTRTQSSQWPKPSFWNLLSADDQATWMRLAPKTWAQMSEDEHRDWKRILTPRTGDAVPTRTQSSPWPKPSFWNLMSADDQATWTRLAPKTWVQMSEDERHDWKRILTPRGAPSVRTRVQSTAFSATSTGDSGAVDEANSNRTDRPGATSDALAVLQSGISVQERAMIESACGYAKRVLGPAAYYDCIDKQLKALDQVASRPDLADVSVPDRTMIEAACGYDRRTQGPAAYYGCLSKRLAALGQVASRPDLADVSVPDRTMIEAACGYDRRTQGPAAYYGCVSKQLAALGQVASQPDLSGVTQAERAMIDSACGYARRVEGPSSYYHCLEKQLSTLA
jgi:hypothetical protein